MTSGGPFHHGVLADGTGPHGLGAARPAAIA